MLKEPTIASKVIYDGKIIKVRVDEVRLSGGTKANREIVEHPGAVAIVALTKDLEVILVKQYRKPVEKELLEIPAGKLDPGEDPLACAKRELLEETGYTADSWKEAFTLLTSPGFSNEKLVIYIATKLHKINDAPIDPEEIASIERLSLKDLLNCIKNKKIEDGKTVAGIMATWVFYANRTQT